MYTLRLLIVLRPIAHVHVCACMCACVSVFTALAHWYVIIGITLPILRLPSMLFPISERFSDGYWCI